MFHLLNVINTVLGTILAKSITIVDILLLLIVVWGGYKGYQRGFLRELIATVVLLFGLLFLFKLVQMGLDWGAKDSGPYNKMIPFTTYILVFFGVALGVKILGNSLKNAISYTLLDDFDQIGGFVIGVLKYAAILAIFIGLLNNVGFVFEEVKPENLLVYPILNDYLNFLIYGASKITPFGDELTKQMKTALQGAQELRSKIK